MKVRLWMIIEILGILAVIVLMAFIINDIRRTEHNMYMLYDDIYRRLLDIEKEKKGHV